MRPISRAKRLAAAAVLGTAMTLAPFGRYPAQAQWAVVCTNCATWTQQLLEYARQAQQLSESVTMRIAQAEMLRNQVTNMISLPNSVWNQIQGNFNATQSLFSQGSGLMSRAAGVSGQLQSYRGLVGSTIDMVSQYTRWSQESNDAVSSRLQGMGLMRQQMAGDQHVIQQIRARSAGAEGAKQAIQANTEMAGAQVNELHRLRELMLADAELNASHFGLEAERRAVEEAANRQFFSSAQQPERGNRRF